MHLPWPGGMFVWSASARGRSEGAGGAGAAPARPVPQAAVLGLALGSNVHLKYHDMMT